VKNALPTVQFEPSPVRKVPKRSPRELIQEENDRASKIEVTARHPIERNALPRFSPTEPA